MSAQQKEIPWIECSGANSLPPVETFPAAMEAVTKQESAPTDNDAWNCLLATNSRLEKRVAELEGVRGDLKTASDVLQDFEGSTVHEQAQQAVRKIDALEKMLKDSNHIKQAALDGVKMWSERANKNADDLAAAKARLKQLEWIPYSERKPMREDADSVGEVVATDGKKEWQLPWDAKANIPTHWRAFAPPTPIDIDRVEFEKWWSGRIHDPSQHKSSLMEAMYDSWKAARAKEEKK